MRKLLLGILIMIPLCGRCEDIKYIAGPELKGKGIYDEIPALHEERVVVSDDGFPPGEISFVFQIPFDRMTLLVRDGLKSAKIGVPTIEKVIFNSESSQPPSFSKSSEEASSSNLERIHNNDIDISKIQTVQLSFPTYNVSNAGSSYSSLKIILADANSLFGMQGSIILVSRVDVSRVNLRTFHLGIPIPVKKSSQVRLITSTEIKIIDDLQKLCGEAAAGTIQTSASGNPFWSFNNLIKMKALLQPE